MTRLQDFTRPLVRGALGAAVIAMACVSASGHGFWLEPSSWHPSIGKPLLFELKVGDGFKGERLPREAEFVESFFYRAGSASGEVKALPGRVLPAGWMRPTDAGAHEVGYESKPRYLELPAAKFEAYLKEEGLERALHCREELGEAKAPGREEFIRCAKTMFDVGGDAVFKPRGPLGLSLEFVAETSPSDPKQPFVVTLLRDGVPVRGARVSCTPKPVKMKGAKLLKVEIKRTDHDGRVAFDLEPGRTWLMTAIAIERCEVPDKPLKKPSSDTVPDWRSYWASLTLKTAL